MIDEKEFIADIEKRYCEPCKKTESDWGGNKCRICWVDDMMDEIETAPKVGEWIPCSERLPEKSGRYLITVKDIGVASCYFNLGYKEHWGINNGKYKDEYVLAWQELPEQYREEKQ